MSLKTMIQQANNKAEKGRKKVYVKKASDSQLLTLLSNAATAVEMAYMSCVSQGMPSPQVLSQAIRELRLLTDVVDKRQH
jgi:hypothetical protein